MIDLLAGASNPDLAAALTDFVNTMLIGDMPLNVREIFFGGHSMAFHRGTEEIAQSQ